MPASNYIQTQLLDHLLRTNTFSKPSAIYISLHSAAPDLSGTPSNELTGGSYARVAVTQADAQWNAVNTSGLTDNVNAITFPTATADWTTATHFGIYDAPTGGNLLMYGALTASKTVANGETPRFAAGALDVTLT